MNHFISILHNMILIRLLGDFFFLFVFCLFVSVPKEDMIFQVQTDLHKWEWKREKDYTPAPTHTQGHIGGGGWEEGALTIMNMRGREVL